MSTEVDRWENDTKVFYFLPAAAGVGYRGFADAWRNCETPSVAGLRRYIHTMPMAAPGTEEDEEPKPWEFGPGYFGGVGELWFDSPAAFEGVKDELRAFYVDQLGEAIDAAAINWLVTREYPVILGARFDQDTEVVKAAFHPRRKEGLTQADFEDYWTGRHAEVAGCFHRAPGNVRYVQGIGLRETYVDPDSTSGERHDAGGNLVDGVAELWWKDVPSLVEALGSPEFLEHQMPDGANFCDMDTNFGFIAIEDRRIWP